MLNAFEYISNGTDIDQFMSYASASVFNWSNFFSLHSHVRLIALNKEELVL